MHTKKGMHAHKGYNNIPLFSPPLTPRGKPYSLEIFPRCYLEGSLILVSSGRKPLIHVHQSTPHVLLTTLLLLGVVVIAHLP